MTMTAVGGGEDSQRMDGLLVNDVSGRYIRRSRAGHDSCGEALELTELRASPLAGRAPNPAPNDRVRDFRAHTQSGQPQRREGGAGRDSRWNPPLIKIP